MLFYGSLFFFINFLFFCFDFLLSTLDKIRGTDQPIGQKGVSVAFVL